MLQLCSMKKAGGHSTTGVATGVNETILTSFAFQRTGTLVRQNLLPQPIDHAR
jgi:hypothetical protein